MATDAHAQAEPDRTEEIRKLPQAEELQLEHRIHLHQDGTLGVSSGGGQKVHTVCTQTVRACIYRHTGGQEEGARSIRHQQSGKGDGKEPARRDAPKHTAENKDFLRTHVHAQGHTLCGSGIPAQKGLAGECAVLQKAEDGTGADRVTTPEAMQMVRMVANRNPDSPYLFPILQSEEGTEAAYREYQSALRGFNQRLAVLRQCLGMQSALSTYAARHTWATMAYHCEIHPGIISEAMGHSSITVTETYLKPFSNRKIDEANQRVISFVRNGACTV